MTGTTKLQVMVKPDSDIKYYEIKVRHEEDAPVTLQRVGNLSTIELATPGRYALLWYFLGPAKATLELTATAGNKNILVSYSSHIPDNNIGAGAGGIPFELDGKP